MDGLEDELGDQLWIIRINVQEPAGRELAPLYDFRFTPTFIYFDADGNELWREVGSLDPERVRENVE